jgi:microcystin-dependent protein
VLFVIIVSVGIYTTWVTYVTVADTDSRISKLNAAHREVTDDLKLISTDVNYNDKILSDEERNTREIINQNQSDSDNRITTIETNIRHDFDALSTKYAEIVEMRGAAALAAASTGIYDTIAASNASVWTGISNTGKIADANLNSRATGLTTTTTNMFNLNSNALNDYRRTNNEVLSSTNDKVAAHTSELGILHSQFGTLSDFSNVTKNRLGNLENWRTNMTTAGGTIDILKNEMRSDMDSKDQTLLSQINAQELNLNVSTGNISKALYGFSNQMSNIGVSVNNAINNLNTQSVLDNPMRSNIFIDNATGQIGMGGRGGVFSSTRLPLADLEINNGGTGKSLMRLTGTTGAAIELNGSGAQWAIDASGNMTLDANPTGGMTLQGVSSGPLVIGSRNVANSAYLQNYKMFVNGTLGVANSNIIELGVGVAGKDVNAGKLLYNTVDNTLHITGAGSAQATRKIALDGEGGVSVAGSLNVAVNKQVCVGSTCISESDLQAFKSWTPIGIITMWSGTVAPPNWGLCDGTTYTRTDGTGTIKSPDLRGRFVMGQGQGTSLTKRTLNDVGGAESVTLTIAQLPAHNHGINDPGHTHTYNTKHTAMPQSGRDTWVWYSDKTATTSISQTGITIQNTGSGQSLSIIPPFYTLAYIIKI